MAQRLSGSGAILWTIDDGLISEARSFIDRDSALEAAGLRE